MSDRLPATEEFTFDEFSPRTTHVKSVFIGGEQWGFTPF
jgi:hypothetical protein